MIMEQYDLIIAGIPLHYAALGQGQPVVFLHGWGCQGSYFAAAAAAIAAHCRCYLLDLPGFGQTPEPAAQYGVPEYAQLVLGFLDALQISRAALVAHSFGGRLALWLAANHPQRITRMVLTGCAGLRPKRTLGYYMRVRMYKLGKRMLRCRFLVAMCKRLGVDLQARMQRAGSEDYRALSADMKQVFVRVVNLDLRDCLPRITCPTVLVWGTQDRSTPLWMGEVMQKTISDCALIPFAGSGHFAYAEQSARFAAILRSFLEDPGE